MRRLLPLAASLAFALTFPPAHAASPLANQPSAFLRSYADSPVNWMLWGDEAFARAQTERKPVFVAIGLFTSELSRAMHRQTFSNADTAAMLNAEFVCVLVDAKERPDLVALYQNYTQHVKQLSGLPLNIWLTPELKPFEGANYLPPTEEWGKEGFLTVAKRALAGWKSDPDAQRAKADEAIATVQSLLSPSTAATISSEEITRILAEASEAHRARFDVTNGGFGEPPKQLEPELLRFLLRDESTREMALTTLRALVHSPVRDPLDGGFFRYASDAEWRQPYFQKNLVDQARMALALLDAAKMSGDKRFASAARSALDYALSLQGAAAEDATPEAILGSYFWTTAEIDDVLGKAEATTFNAAHGVTVEGNVPADTFTGIPAGKNLLYVAKDAPDEESFAQARKALLERRRARAQPLRDDVAPASTHGLLLTALVRAGAQLSDTRFASAAVAQAKFIREKLITPDGTLLRLPGRTSTASAADYAAVIEGLLALHAISPSPELAALAEKLRTTADSDFFADGVYYATSAKAGPAFWARVRALPIGPGEPPAAEPSMLSLPNTPTDAAAKLAATIAADIANSAEVARGDQLLALQTHLTSAVR